MTADISDAARAAADAAGRCLDERRFVDAIPHAREAAELAPSWTMPWLLLAVALKHAREWWPLLDAVDRAIALGARPGSLAGAHWNAAIAATALGDWTRARASWAAAGVQIPDGVGPIELEIGRTPVRVGLDATPEVIWCHRIDPCRARIAGIPRPESGRRHRDLVLHDGEPRGHRPLGTRMVSVFDELVVLERSRYRTWEATVRAPRPVVVGRLLELFDDTEVVTEDWTATGSGVWQVERRLAFATDDESALAPLHGRREILSLRVVD